MVSHVLIFLGALICALILQWGLLTLVARPKLLAMPNQRSSHRRPTPTMGGVVAVLMVLVFCVSLAQTDTVLGWGLFAGLVGVAGIGLWDDLQPLPGTMRLLVHILSSTAVLFALQTQWPQPLTGPIAAVAVFFLVWSTNLYNFMDGIDGYAALQCLSFCLGVQMIGLGVPGWAGDLVWLLSGAALGFLAFNWPPAKIFMGDVGSGFLGLVIGLLVLHLWQTDIVPLSVSLILLATFWFDATYTLFVRLVTGQRVMQAHRLHLYQWLAMRRGHLYTNAVFLVFSVFWLMPLAWWAFPASRTALMSSAAIVLAILPMLFACWRFKVGLPAGEDVA